MDKFSTLQSVKLCLYITLQVMYDVFSIATAAGDTQLMYCLVSNKVPLDLYDRASNYQVITKHSSHVY